MEQETKKYEGSVYIGVVGSETENGECRDSIDKLIGRPGDIGPQFIRATKGFEARQMHLDNFIHKTDCAFVFMMDSDTVFPANALERLRSHGLPYVSGAYQRRRYNPVAPVWFEPLGDDLKFPFKPWVGETEPNRLYEIGASGWGCVLIHRDVVLAVEQLLKGEALVIEDDMDIWPYDLPRIMAALSVLKTMTKKDNVPASALREYVDILADEIRPLRGLKDNVGSDIRFPFFARAAGYRLMLDTGVDCYHMINYPLQLNDFMSQPRNVREQLMVEMERQKQEETRRIEDELRMSHIADTAGMK